MDNQQDTRTNEAVELSTDDDFTYVYALLHAVLGVVLLVAGKADPSEAARLLGLGFIALSVINLFRPVQMWKRRRARRHMRKVSRQHAKELKKAAREKAAISAHSLPVVSPEATLANDEKPPVIRASILSRISAEQPTLVQ